MKLYFVRHGHKTETFDNDIEGFPNHELTALGREQAVLTGRRLSNIKFDHIFSSDLVRAKKTASYIALGRSNMAVQTDPRLREIHMGITHTMTDEEIKQSHPDFHRDYHERSYDFTYPEGESASDVVERVMNFIDTFEDDDAEHVCFVCHGGTIRVMMAHFMDIPQHKRFNLHPSHCGISVVDYDKATRKAQVLTINEFQHLGDTMTL